MRESKGPIWGAVYFKNREGILSSPDDLFGSKFSISFFIPLISIFMDLMVEYLVIFNMRIFC